MTATLKPTIIYSLTELMSFATGLKQRHDDAALLKKTGPGNELTDAFRESQMRQDEQIISRLKEFEARGITQVTAEALISDTHPMGNVHDSLYMQVANNKLKPVVN